ncbi:monocarboxylate transporter 12-like isoform X2 [Ptychodera flava]|uniref:monocarboxylate transporter 12-like isoform X2 n=1 Tax=Ptychodera flava TaxID=63121 RepID=UPI00396A7CE5
MEAAIGDHPDGGWGWVIVFASFLGFFISAGLLNSFSVIYVAFLDAFKESKAVTAWISGIFDVAFTFSASYGVAFSKRFGHRKAVMAAGVLASLGILTSGFTTHVYQLFFTYGVLTGAGMGVVYVTCIEIVSIYFKKRFPIAIGLASAGAGAGQFVLSLVTQMMVDQYGWRGMLLFMSAFTLHLCVAGALMRPLRARQLPTKHRSPDKDLQRSQKDDECNKKIYSSEENHSKAEESAESYDMITVKDKTVDRKPKKTFARRCKSYFLSIYDVTLFQEPVFITICIIGVGQVFGINSASIHLVRRARDFGISYNFGSYIPAVMGLVQLIARPCFGAAGHIRCLGPSVTFAVAIFACGISLIISIYAISFTSQVILLAIYGTCSGGYFVFRAIVIKHFLGDEKVGQATSLLIQVLGIISFFAAPLGGWMRDSSGIYDGFFWLSGSWLLLASVLAAFLPMINRLGKLKCRQGKSKAEDNDVETKSESTDSILSTP